jgi:hypothetical protein
MLIAQTGINGSVKRYGASPPGDQTAAAKLLRDQINERIAQLDRQEENLYDLAAGEDGPKDRLRARLARIAAERSRLSDELEQADDRLEVGAALLEAALNLLKNPEELYWQSGPKARRSLNQAIFEKLYVFEDEVTGHVLRRPFAELHGAQEVLRGGIENGVGKRRRHLMTPPVDRSPKADLLVAALSSGNGSSKTAMVGDEGFEPPTLSV